MFVTLIGISKVNSFVYEETDADGIVLVPNGTIKYFTNVHQVIYEMDTTTINDFNVLIQRTFDLLSVANQLYANQFQCQKLWNNEVLEKAYGSRLKSIDCRKNCPHWKADMYFKGNEKYLKFEIKSEIFNVIDEDVMHELYKNHKKLRNITHPDIHKVGRYGRPNDLKRLLQYELYGRHEELRKFLMKAYKVSMDAVEKYKPILLMLQKMDKNEWVKYDSEFLSLINDMQNKPDNTFVYDPVSIFENLQVIYVEKMHYVISNIYITNNNVYNTHIVNSLMVRHPRSTLTTSLKQPGDILCDSLKYNEDYFYMSWEQDSKCVMERGYKMCPVNPKLKNSVTEIDCIYSLHRGKFDIDLCSKDLRFSKYIQETTFQQLDSNVWYFYIHTHGFLNTICDRLVTHTYIRKTGLVMLNGGCHSFFTEKGQEKPIVYLITDYNMETNFTSNMISKSNGVKYKAMLEKNNLFDRVDSNW